MTGRRDAPPCPSPGSATAALEISPDHSIADVTPAASLIVAHLDTSIRDRSVADLANAGLLTAESATAIETALEAVADGGETTVHVAVSRTGNLGPIEYTATVLALEQDGFRVRLSEVGPLDDHAETVRLLRQATRDLGNQETIRNVFGTIERWAHEILGPTGIDIRRADEESDDLIRISRAGATTPVDDQSTVDGLSSPYCQTWPAGETVVQTEWAAGFTETVMVPIGTVGTITMGRVGCSITEIDRWVLELLASTAATAFEAVHHRSTVADQRAALDRYETLVESIPDPVFSTDEAGRITYVNEAFEDAFGYSLAECRGERITEFTTRETAERIQNEIWELLDPDFERHRQIAATGITADGRECEIEASVGVVYHDNEYDGVVGVLRDVTERKRHEEITNVMNRALRHNLRTSINNIIGYAELTEQGAGDTEEYMQVIREEGEWLMKLGNTLRAVRRSIDDGRDRSAMPVDELVEPLVREYQTQYPETNLSTTFETTEPIKGGSTLQVALDNVLENAIEHNQDQNPRVQVRTWCEETGWVSIEIRDNGPGMNERDIDIVMGETEITQLQHGTGIGLWLTRWIVEIFEGELELETSDDGTVVRIRLQEAEN